MGNNNRSETSAYPIERKHRRFPLRYPVRLEFSSGRAHSEIEATSRNVSIGGLLLDVPSLVPEHCPVTFTMTVQGGLVVRPIELVGEGKVVRVEAEESAGGFAVAVECTRPIAEMADYLDALGSSPRV
jgi:hypothetical protein